MSLEQKACQCCETSDQEKYEQIREVIENYRDKEGSLIQVLNIAQGIYGYLPLELQKFIAEGLDMPLSTVSGVVTFYSFFSTKPRGKHTIRVCLGTACYVKGAVKIVEKLTEILDTQVGETTKDQKFTFEVARCVGACGLAPVVVIDNVVHQQVKPDQLSSILAKY